MVERRTAKCGFYHLRILRCQAGHHPGYRATPREYLRRDAELIRAHDPSLFERMKKNRITMTQAVWQ